MPIIFPPAYEQSQCPLSYSSYSYYDWLCERNHWPFIHFMSSFLLYYTARDAVLVLLLAYLFETYEIIKHFTQNENKLVNQFEATGNILISDILLSFLGIATGYLWIRIFARWEKRFHTQFPENILWYYSRGDGIRAYVKRVLLYVLTLCLLLPGFQTYQVQEWDKYFDLRILWITLGYTALSFIIEWPLVLLDSSSEARCNKLKKTSQYFLPRTFFVFVMGLSHLYLWTYGVLQVLTHAAALCILTYFAVSCTTHSHDYKLLNSS